MTVDMRENEVARAMNVLDAVGDDMVSTWQRAAADIAELSGVLGRGPLGARFASAYGPARESFERATNHLIPVAKAMATAGRDCLTCYARADADAAAALLGARLT